MFGTLVLIIAFTASARASLHALTADQILLLSGLGPVELAITGVQPNQFASSLAPAIERAEVEAPALGQELARLSDLRKELARLERARSRGVQYDSERLRTLKSQIADLTISADSAFSRVIEAASLSDANRSTIRVVSANAKRGTAGQDPRTIITPRDRSEARSSRNRGVRTQWRHGPVLPEAISAWNIAATARSAPR